MIFKYHFIVIDIGLMILPIPQSPLNPQSPFFPFPKNFFGGLGQIILRRFFRILWPSAVIVFSPLLFSHLLSELENYIYRCGYYKNNSCKYRYQYRRVWSRFIIRMIVFHISCRLYMKKSLLLSEKNAVCLFILYYIKQKKSMNNYQNIFLFVFD